MSTFPLNTCAFFLLPSRSRQTHSLLAPRQHVDHGVLEESSENDDHAEGVPNIQSFGVWHLHGGAPGAAQLGCHGEQGGHPQGDAGRHSVSTVTYNAGVKWGEI